MPTAVHIAAGSAPCFAMTSSKPTRRFFHLDVGKLVPFAHAVNFNDFGVLQLGADFYFGLKTFVDYTRPNRD